tara:strand:- start:300 stop:581 length:282 start_codon:yes stop_codon:yes gene_type:complete
MKVKELMERSNIQETGRAIAYIKDALDEMNLESETHTKTVRIDIVEGKRFYEVPNEAVKILDIRCKHHDNASSLYKSIPRTIYEPDTEDTDGY